MVFVSPFALDENCKTWCWLKQECDQLGWRLDKKQTVQKVDVLMKKNLKIFYEPDEKLKVVDQIHKWIQQGKIDNVIWGWHQQIHKIRSKTEWVVDQIIPSDDLRKAIQQGKFREIDPKTIRFSENGDCVFYKPGKIIEESKPDWIHVDDRMIASFVFF